MLATVIAHHLVVLVDWVTQWGIWNFHRTIMSMLFWPKTTIIMLMFFIIRPKVLVFDNLKTFSETFLQKLRCNIFLNLICTYLIEKYFAGTCNTSIYNELIRDEVSYQQCIMVIMFHVFFLLDLYFHSNLYLIVVARGFTSLWTKNEEVSVTIGLLRNHFCHISA